MKRRHPITRVTPAPERLEEKSLPGSVPGLLSFPAVHVRSTDHSHAALDRLAAERRAPAHHKLSRAAARGDADPGVGAGDGVSASAPVGHGSSTGSDSGTGNGSGSGSGSGSGGGVGRVGSNGGGTSNSGGTSNGSGGGVGIGVGIGVGVGVGTSALTLGPDAGSLVPPFGLVPADPSPPVGGAVYNVALVTVRNATSQTFTAQSGLSVAVAGNDVAEPILTGSDLWKPGQVLVIYSFDQDTFPPDFVFNLQGSSVDEPADIYYGIQYSPNTLPSIVDSIVSTVLVGGRFALTSE